jgi:hypothetical protein
MPPHPNIMRLGIPLMARLMTSQFGSNAILTPTALWRG